MTNHAHLLMTPTTEKRIGIPMGFVQDPRPWRRR
jgi:hypothetical protein